MKHAKAHAQMLRQTISAIKTEVWDPSLGPADSWDLSFGSCRFLRSIFGPERLLRFFFGTGRLCLSNADQDFVGRRTIQVIRSSAIWLLSVCEELLWCTLYQWAFPLPIWWWVKRDYIEVIPSEIEVWCDCIVNTWYCRLCVFIKIKLQSAVRNSPYFITRPREFSLSKFWMMICWHWQDTATKVCTWLKRFHQPGWTPCSWKFHFIQHDLYVL